MTVAAAARIALIVFVVAVLQVSAFSSISIARRPRRTCCSSRSSRSRSSAAPSPGLSTGFAAGLLVDVATLGTLGVTSLLLTLAGFWAGRYGETTGRGRPHAPLVAVLAATVLVDVGGYVLDFAARRARADARGPPLALPAALVLNGLLTYPVFALTRRLVGATERVERAREVELVV